MSQFFIKDLDETGHPKIMSCVCGDIFTEQGMARHKRGCKGYISKLKNRLYYIEHKDEINKNRKKYKRQTWRERADNPHRTNSRKGND